jgi:Zn-dependent protease
MNDRPDEERVQSEPTAVPPPMPEPRLGGPTRPARPPARPPIVRALAGSLRLFRVAGIDVFVHWSWLVVAYFRIKLRAADGSPEWSYTSPVWYVVEYLAVFVIVLLHEFGHALACRSVGGQANRIVLWPLGGVALVAPPPRPGAFLWSLAAGPLVNVLLLPPTIGLVVLSHLAGWGQTMPDLDTFLSMLALINGGLLFFNLLPIFPLDGGQIVQALLWFVIGRGRSLMVVTAISLVTGLALLGVALAFGQLWLGVICAFAVLTSLGGLQRARALLRLQAAPRHAEAVCPSCGTSPPVGDFWLCGACRGRFDVFEYDGICPDCGTAQPGVLCLECGRRRHHADWFPGVIPVEKTAEPTAEF